MQRSPVDWFAVKLFGRELPLSQDERRDGFTREVETKADGRYVVYYSFAASSPKRADRGETARAETAERGEEATDV